jgi:hypothetical protein
MHWEAHRQAHIRDRLASTVGANGFLKNLTMMDSVQLLSREMGTVSTPIPTAGLVISTVLSMMTMAILAVCLSEFHGRRISRNFLTILPSSENTSDEELV